MIKAGIIGGAGYTAGELIRILINHPKVEICFIQSSSNAGNRIYEVHTDLIGETDLRFVGDPDFSSVDVLFLCVGHGKSKEFVTRNEIPGRVKIIDLSQDFRIKSDTHDFVYGLPELNRDQIQKASHIANPGCFATGIQLALFPLAINGLLSGDLHVNAITGSTGAGQALSETSHFSWRDSNISAYKIFEHQHEAEIVQSLKHLQPGFSHNLNFIPVRGNFTRGIFATVYTKFAGPVEDAINLYQEYYDSHPFVFLTESNPNLKQVVNTNKALLHLEKHNGYLVVISITDNLIKGASGQAIQNMNLMFDLDEKAGLNLKPVVF
jgi:N-acetyl-gamma-glutamyl-phosphate reductase